jgi:hypothetical protein
MKPAVYWVSIWKISATLYAKPYQAAREKRLARQFIVNLRGLQK